MAWLGCMQFGRQRVAHEPETINKLPNYVALTCSMAFAIVSNPIGASNAPRFLRRSTLKITLKQLEAFVWVSDLGSFRRAAERLHTTQPNISTRISTLETALSVKLLERDPGSVRQTFQGRQLLAHARKVLQTTEGLIAAADQPALFDETLRLGVTEMIVQTWLRAYLKTLRERFPNLTVELTADLSANLSKNLFERSIDLAL
jgi:DNA-binding transcriptional LysR family regulator